MSGNVLKLLWVSRKFLTTTVPTTTGNTLLHVFCKCMEFQRKIANHYNKSVCMVGSEKNVFTIIHNRLKEYADFDRAKRKLECNQNLIINKPFKVKSECVLNINSHTNELNLKYNLGKTQIDAFNSKLIESNNQNQNNITLIKLPLLCDTKEELSKHNASIRLWQDQKLDVQTIEKFWSQAERNYFENKAAAFKSNNMSQPNYCELKENLPLEEKYKISQLFQSHKYTDADSNIEHNITTNVDNIEANTVLSPINGSNRKHSLKNPLKLSYSYNLHSSSAYLLHQRSYHFDKEKRDKEIKNRQKNYKEMEGLIVFVTALERMGLLEDIIRCINANKNNLKVQTDNLEVNKNTLGNKLEMGVKDIQINKKSNKYLESSLIRCFDDIKEQINLLEINNKVFENMEQLIRNNKIMKTCGKKSELPENISTVNKEKNAPEIKEKLLYNLKIIRKQIKSSKKNLELRRNKQIQYRRNLLKSLEQIRHQTRYLTGNKTVLHNIEANIEKMKTMNFEDSTNIEQINILEITNKVFKNIQNGVDNVKLAENGGKNIQLSENKYYSLENLNNINDQKGILGINKKALEILKQRQMIGKHLLENKSTVFKCQLKQGDQITEDKGIVKTFKIVFDDLAKNIEGNDMKAHTNIFESNQKKPLTNLEMNVKESEKPNKNLEEFQNKNIIYKCKLFSTTPLDQNREDTAALNMNKTATDNHHNMKPTNIDDFKERIKLLEINNKVFENMEKFMRNLKTIEKPGKKPLSSSSSNHTSDFDEIKEQRECLDSNEKILENQQMLMEDITKKSGKKLLSSSANNISTFHDNMAQINLLEFSNKVFDNMEKNILNINKQKKSISKLSSSSPNHISNFDDIRKQSQFLDSSNKILENLEKLMSNITEKFGRTLASSLANNNVSTFQDIKEQIMKLLEIINKVFDNMENVILNTNMLEKSRTKLLTSSSNHISSFNDIREQRKFLDRNDKKSENKEKFIGNIAMIDKSGKKSSSSANNMLTFDDNKEPITLSEIINKVFQNMKNVMLNINMQEKSSSSNNKIPENMENLEENITIEKSLSSANNIEDNKKRTKLLEIINLLKLSSSPFNHNLDFHEIKEERKCLDSNNIIFENKEKLPENITFIEKCEKKRSLGDNISNFYDNEARIKLLDVNNKVVDNMVNVISNMKVMEKLNRMKPSSLNFDDRKEQIKFSGTNNNIFQNMETVTRNSQMMEKSEKKRESSEKKFLFNHRNNEKQASILGVNKLLVGHLEMGIKEMKMNQNAKNNLELSQSANMQYQRDLLEYLDDVRVPACILESNSTTCDAIEKIIQNIKMENLHGINEQIKLLHINNKECKNIEKNIGDIKITDKSKKTPKISPNKKTVINYDEDIMERTNILEINEKVFDNVEKVIKRIKIIDKPKKALEIFPNKKISTENLNSFPVLTENLNITNAIIEVETENNKQSIHESMSKLRVLLNDSFQVIESIQKEALVLLHKQLLEQVCAGTEHSAPVNNPECLSSLMNQVESDLIDMSSEITTNNVEKDSEVKFENEQILDTFDQTLDITTENKTLPFPAEQIQRNINEDSETRDECVDNIPFPRIGNIHNKLPLYFRKHPNTLILPETTFWNAQPKLSLNFDSHNIHRQMKMECRLSKKYRLETKEIKSLLGDKIKITRLISEKDGQ